MDSDRIEGKWKEIKGKLQENFGALTDDELEQAKGDRAQMEGLIQQRLGQTKDEARKTVDDILNSI